MRLKYKPNDETTISVSYVSKGRFPDPLDQSKEELPWCGEFVWNELTRTLLLNVTDQNQELKVNLPGGNFTIEWVNKAAKVKQKKPKKKK